MSRPLSQIVGGLRSVRDYFERSSREDASFLPEWEVAVEIVRVIEDGAMDPRTRDRVRRLVEAPLRDHHDGTGWEHFRSLIREWLEATRVAAGEPS